MAGVHVGVAPTAVVGVGCVNGVGVGVTTKGVGVGAASRGVGVGVLCGKGVYA